MKKIKAVTVAVFGANITLAKTNSHNTDTRYKIQDVLVYSLS